MKMRGPAKNVDAYIADFPSEVQESLQKLRATIMKAVPGLTEAIKYGIPTFVLKRNLIHFAAYKNHIGLYPGSKAVENFKKELAKYELSKGTIRLPLDKPLPLGLITKITKFNAKVQKSLSDRPLSRHGSAA
jgi:uncharacterized protein YdhG (YjbR/CyaY superfamily)